MTTQIAYEANRARLDDYHRRAAEHRRAADRRRRGPRLGVLIRHRRRRGSTTRSPAPAA